MLKTVGCIVLAASFGAMGAYRARLGKKTLADLSTLCDLSRYITDTVKKSASPVSEIYAGYAALRGGDFASFLASKGSLADGINTFMPYLPREVADNTLRFAEALGCSFLSEQIALCEKYRDFLCAKQSEYEKKYAEKIPLYRSLWLISGLIAVIILL